MYGLSTACPCQNSFRTRFSGPGPYIRNEWLLIVKIKVYYELGELWYRRAHNGCYMQSSGSHFFSFFLPGAWLYLWVTSRMCPSASFRRTLISPLSSSRSSTPWAKSSSTINSSFTWFVSIRTSKISTWSPLVTDSSNVFFHDFCINKINGAKVEIPGEGVWQFLGYNWCLLFWWKKSAEGASDNGRCQSKFTV